jgi:uncharacterized protein YjlB
MSSTVRVAPGDVVLFPATVGEWLPGTDDSVAVVGSFPHPDSDVSAPAVASADRNRRRDGCFIPDITGCGRKIDWYFHADTGHYS